eukprot:m.342004 g.342004  ORF g.342004 m.342004 type:complete len:570 (+) comp19837_c0_seq1:659-2368(+)
MRVTQRVTHRHAPRATHRTQAPPLRLAFVSLTVAVGGACLSLPRVLHAPSLGTPNTGHQNTENMFEPTAPTMGAEMDPLLRARDVEMHLPPTASTWGRAGLADFANVFKAFLGTNWLSIPFAFAAAGTGSGLIMLLVIAAATCHTSEMIIDCKQLAIAELRRQGKISPDPAELEKVEHDFQFGDIGGVTLGTAFANEQTQLLTPFVKAATREPVVFFSFSGPCLTPSHQVAFGKPGRILTDFMVALTQFGFCAGYFIFLGNTLRDFINSFGHDLELEVCIVMFAPFFALCTLMKDVRTMAPLSAFANVAMVLGYSSVIGFAAHAEHGVHADVEWFDMGRAAVFFGIVSADFEGVGVVVPLQSSMSGNRKSFKTYLRVTVGLLTVLLGAFGIFGYMCYGPNVTQIIIAELPVDAVVARAVRIALLFAVCLTYPLQLFPVLQLAIAYLFGEKAVVEVPQGSIQSIQHDNVVPPGIPAPGRQNNKIAIIAVKWTIVIATCGLAIAFKENLGYFISINGAIGCTVLAFVLPSCIEFRLRDDLSTFAKVKNVALILFGVGGGIASLYSTLNQLL